MNEARVLYLALFGAWACACGDNRPGLDVDAESRDASLPSVDAGLDASIGCTDLADPPPSGLLESIDDLPALDGCVAGGMTERDFESWFVRSSLGPVDLFGYGYPGFGYTCEFGLEMPGFEYSWSDGTSGFVRFGVEDKDFKYAVAAAFCFDSEGLLVYTEKACFRDSESTECFSELSGVGVSYPRLGETAGGVELIGEDAASFVAFDVDIKGDIAYVATFDSVVAYDLSDPLGFVRLGEIPLKVDTINDIEVLVAGDRRYAYVSALQTVIVDVTDPANMLAIGSIDVSGRDPYSHTVQIGRRGDVPVLYLGGQVDVPVYSLEDPELPVYLGTIAIAESQGTHDMTVDGALLYVNDGPTGFVVLDTTLLDAPVELARRHGSFYDHASAVGAVNGRRLVVHGGEGLELDGAGTRLRIYDGDSASKTYMELLGTYAVRAETGIHNMVIADDLIFIAYYQDGLRVVDASDPANPVEVAHFNSWVAESSFSGPFSGAIGVDVGEDGSIVLVNYEGEVFRLRRSENSAGQ